MWIYNYRSPKTNRFFAVWLYNGQWIGRGWSCVHWLLWVLDEHMAWVLQLPFIQDEGFCCHMAIQQLVHWLPLHESITSARPGQTHSSTMVVMQNFYGYHSSWTNGFVVVRPAAVRYLLHWLLPCNLTNIHPSATNVWLDSSCSNFFRRMVSLWYVILYWRNVRICGVHVSMIRPASTNLFSPDSGSWQRSVYGLIISEDGTIWFSPSKVIRNNSK